MLKVKEEEDEIGMVRSLACLPPPPFLPFLFHPSSHSPSIYLSQSTLSNYDFVQICRASLIFVTMCFA